MKLFRIIVVCLCIALFNVILFNVCKYGVLDIDNNVYNFISNNIMNDTLSSVLKVVAHLGDVAFNVLLGVLCFMFCKKNRWFITFDLVVCTIINQTIKHIVRRPRPNILRLVEESGYSFPSGHSMISVALFSNLSCL